MKMKSEYEQNIALSEAFLEAVPTTLIIFISSNLCKQNSKITIIFLNSYSDFKLLLIYIVVQAVSSSEVSDGGLRTILTDDYSTLSLITFFLSIFSSSFGLAKCLKTGVAGTFQHGGVLDGLCSGQFLLAFLGKQGKIRF